MADVSCSQDIETRKIFKLTLAELKVPVLSQAKSLAERFQRIKDGKEVLARGQKQSETDVQAIKEVRRYLNSAVKDCAPLDADKGVFDKEMEQRVALFQKRHVATDSRFAGEKEIDGVVGKNTYARLIELGASDTAKEGKALPETAQTPKEKLSAAEAEKRAKDKAEMAERRRLRAIETGVTVP